jgi:carnitine 3-dehydrogenase
MSKIAACIGSGVIGAGWVARFLLHGWQVNVYDPSPNTQALIDKVLTNARHALPAIADVPMPEEGELVYCDSIQEAVDKAVWIQESVPERLELKHSTYQEIQRHCLKEALLGSSTSGFTPTQLQQDSLRAEQIVVAHPFNPVYLLPLVELVAIGDGRQDSLKRSEQILKSIGLQPVVVRTEIEGHIADRLLEAVWRESLWLIKDGGATTEEIDDAIRLGFGLRWAQMGLFETYRIAGGERGMAHFIAQFGPALQWPWTKLMDVPELTQELIDKISDQSDQQSGHYSISELERIRDDNLIGIMRIQKQHDWGVGKVLRRHDDYLARQTQPISALIK